ncbi:unnamed protein product [Allacma fusca]|nr:unnamed protein product [Allacma fusca]
MSQDPDYPDNQPHINLAEEVLTSIHKRENSRDNQFVENPVAGATSDFFGVTLLQEPVVEEISTPDRGVAWEYHSVTLTRVPGYGFGIAVSGGRDNPHFANGDPAIAISDVLKSGPAEGKLLVNDRILSANGISLENVDYATAVQVLRDSGPSVQLVVKRRVVLPQGENSTFKVTLTRKKRSDDFGIVLGCKLYIKEVTNKIADKENTINEGDIVLKINSNGTDGLTLKEAKKLMESSKEKLHLVVKRDVSSTTFQLGSAATLQQQQQQQLKGSNYLEVLDCRPSYSSQNLYVQPPTRDTGRLNRSIDEDKNNLMRIRRGPLVGQEQQHQSMVYDPPPPPRPPLPRTEDEVSYPEPEVYSPRRQLLFDEIESSQTAVSPPSRRVQLDPRYVTFVKEAGSVGIRLTGGNATGIYVAAVQPNSPAAVQGLQPGDKILKVNETELISMTREEAVLLLLNLQDTITMLVHFKPDEFDGVNKQNGDSFYIRTHFNYEQPRKNEFTFKRGEVFHVTDTLFNGAVGSWQVYRVNKAGQDGEKGVIPNKTQADEFALRDIGTKKEGSELTKTGSFFRRRKPGGSGRRSKSLNYEEIYSEAIKFPAYERVVLKHPGFVRPVVIFGPVADIARERLLRDYPEKFAVPSAAGESTDGSAPRPIRLSGIKQIIDQNKHALIDVTPHGVERLVFTQLYPIVLFLKADSKQAVKEIRNGVVNNKQQSSLSLLKSPRRRPSTKKLFEDSLKLERAYPHIITCSLNLTDSWYRRVRDAIDREQNKMIWAADVKSLGNGGDALNLLAEDDFFLFPTVTSPRYSYASSPESEADLDASELKDSQQHGVNKSTSDPSIIAQEDLMSSVQLPNYNAPPPYSVMGGGSNGFVQDVFRITKKQRDYTPPPHLPQQPQVNPPTLPKNSKLVLTHSPPDSPISNPNFVSPPQIDRSKKPHGIGKSAAERLFGDSYSLLPGDGHISSESQNSPLRNVNNGLHENGNYETGNYRWASPQQLPQQTQLLNGVVDHDVYRYTRSTAQPADKSRDSSPNKASYTSHNGTPRTNYKPAPPPKAYKPVPPPKPQKIAYSNYNSTSAENNYMNGKSPDPSLNQDHDNGGFDSGHGSSLDRSSRNYSKYVYPSNRVTSSSSNQPYYLNVPPPKTPNQQHQPIDLVNREQRGSAFELYRKPSELCLPPQHHQRVFR